MYGKRTKKPENLIGEVCKYLGIDNSFTLSKLRKQENVDFIGIGAQKSGTSWVNRCLAEHPDICTPYIKRYDSYNPETNYNKGEKETHFFDRFYEKGIEYYISLFPDCTRQKIRGEFTPKYLFDPDVPKRIYTHFPRVKLIAILRNPVDRAYSAYRYGVMRGKYKRLSFEEAIDKDHQIIARGKYARQLTRYFDLFPKENIYVCIYDYSLANPLSFIQDIYTFLNVDKDYVPPSVHLGVNKSKDENLNSHVSKKVREEVMSKYTDEIIALEELLQKDLDIWRQ